MRVRRIFTEHRSGFAEGWRDDPPALRLELRSFCAHPLEQDVNIVATLTGVLVADVADFRFRPSRRRRLFADDARFFGTCGRVRGGWAQVRVEKRDALLAGERGEFAAGFLAQAA